MNGQGGREMYSRPHAGLLGYRLLDSFAAGLRIVAADGNASLRFWRGGTGIFQTGLETLDGSIDRRTKRAILVASLYEHIRSEALWVWRQRMWRF
jgi:hypothetical protein